MKTYIRPEIYDAANFLRLPERDGLVDTVWDLSIFNELMRRRRYRGTGDEFIRKAQVWLESLTDMEYELVKR